MMNNSIRPETRLDVKMRTNDLPTLPSLNEVIKPIFDNQQQMYNIQGNFPKGNTQPTNTANPVARVPSSPKNMNMMPFSSILNPMPPQQSSSASKQSILSTATLLCIRLIFA